MSRLVAGRLGVSAVFDGERLVPGDVTLTDGVVTGIGVGDGSGDHIAVPGLVDLQVNGFAGIDVLATSPDGLAVMEDALVAHGVTAYRPTLVSSTLRATERALQRLQNPSRIHRLPAHLEGPFLSTKRPGAHRTDRLRVPDAALVQHLLEVAVIGHVTIAPELPRALHVIRRLLDSGVTVAIGHTDATAAEAGAAFDLGANAITHIFNAHRPLLARDPGPAGAALARDDVWIQCIADGVHLAPEILRLLDRAAGDRLIAVTDAMPAAGLGDGRYEYAGQWVTVAGSEARLDSGALAGSVAGLDGCLRTLVDVDLPLERALAAVTSRPARAVGRPDLGHVTVGSAANLVVLDARLRPVRTFVNGVVQYDADQPVGGGSDG